MRLRSACIYVCLLLVLGQTSVCLAESGYLYVNSNTGAASGGHVGFKSGPDVYHYQFFPDERFLLVRESWDHFRLIYNRLRNRTILSAELPSPAVGRIDQGLREALLTQEIVLQREEQLRQNQSLLEAVLSGRGRASVVGLGFFAAEPRESEGGIYIREGVVAQLGEDVLSQALQTAENDLSEIFQSLENWQGTPAELPALLDELENLIAKRSALTMLLSARGLSSDALLGEIQPVRLNDGKVAGFRNYLDLKISGLARLVTSSRVDSGTALLLQLARCHALYVTTEKAQLFTLDPFPDGSRTKRVDLLDRDSESFLVELAEFLLSKTRTLAGQANRNQGAGGDLWYSLLERYNGKLDEIVSARMHGDRVRLATESMVPSRSRSAMLLPTEASSYLRQWGRAFISDQRSAEAELIRKSYSYNLMLNNCVNRLLRTANNSFSGPVEAERMLGAYLDPVADRVVIPHDFFYQVSTRYRVHSIIPYPSRRLAGLKELPEDEQGFGLWLREGNTLSSTLYQHRPADSPFLFFTDNLFWARPVLGLINLGWATLNSAAGIALLPGDGGDKFVQGFRGMFYSVPELLFCNIRKGTYDYEDFSNRTNDL
jgi:hypothetical protein